MAGFLDLGALRIGITADATEANDEFNKTKSGIKDLDETTGKHTGNIQSHLKDKLGGAAKAAGVALAGLAAAGIAALAGLAAKGIDLASDLAEVQNVVDTTFGDKAALINGWAVNAAGAFGLSQLEAKGMTGTMGAMLKSMGLTSEQTLTMSEGLVGLAGDFSSFYNLSHDEAWEKIRAGIAGETEPLKQLGINMSVANLNAYALAQGISKPYEKMSQSEQTILRYNYLMSVTKDAQGDFAKTSSSWANQTRIAQLNIENLASGLGTKLLPSLGNVLQIFNKVAEESGSDASKFIANMGSIVDAGMKAVEEILPILTGLATDIINGIITILPKIIELGGQIIIKLVTGLVDMLPQIAAAAGQIVGELAAGIITNLPQIIGAFLQAIPMIIGGFVAGLLGLGDAFKDAIEKAGALRKEIDDLTAAAEKSNDAFKENIDNAEKEAIVSQNMADELYNLAAKENKSNEEKARMKFLVEQLNKIYPQLNLKIDEATGKLSLEKKAIEEVIKAKWDEIKLKAYEDVLIEKEKEKVQLLEARKEAQDKVTESEAKYQAMIGQGGPFYEIQKVQLEQDRKTLADLDAQIEKNTADTNTYKSQYADMTTANAAASTTAKDTIVANEQETSAKTAEEQAVRQKAQEEYAKKLEDTTQTHVTQMDSIYDKEISVHKETIKQVEKNLKTQVKQFEDWQSDIQKLAGRVPSSVLAELEKLGPESAPLIKSLVSANDKDLGEFVTVWEKKGAAAKSAAVTELGGMPDEVKTVVTDTNTVLNDTTTVATSSKNLGKTITTGVKEGINEGKASVVSAATSIGEAIINGMKQGLNNKVGSLLVRAREIANEITKTIKKAYDINSPSRVFAQIGQYMAEGLDVGFSNQMSKVTKNINNLMPIPNYSTAAVLSTGSTSRQAPAAASNKTITQNINFTSRQLSPYEQQLQVRRLSKELAGAF
jgi:hypothetical protein